MRWPPKKVILAIVIVAIILIIWSGRTSVTSTELLTDRVWIDRVPSSPRDVIDGLSFSGEHDLGVIAKMSSYRISMDLVRWSVEGDRLTLHLLQEDRTISSSVRTWECEDGEAPEGYDYCMDLDGRRFFAGDHEDARIRRLLDP